MNNLLDQFQKEIASKISFPIDKNQVYLVLKALGLTRFAIYDLGVAIQNLEKILGANRRYDFSDLSEAINELVDSDMKSSFLSEFPSGGLSNKSSMFRISNDMFCNNYRYGVFAGITEDVADNLTLEINLINPTYNPILTMSLICLVAINKTRAIDSEPYKGIENFCKNIKMLASSKKWKDDFGAWLGAFLRTKNIEDNYSVNQLFIDINLRPTKFDELSSVQKSFLKKIADIIKNDLDAILPRIQQESTKERLFIEDENSDYDRHKEHKSEVENSVKLYRKPTQITEKHEKEFNPDSQLFLRTIGMNENAKDAQNIKFTNKHILSHEIKEIEIFIQKILKNSEDISEKKIALCWSLMLYYSIPVDRVNTILIGAPGKDFDTNKIESRIIIDVNEDLIFLPTPSQTLHANDDEKDKHLHLPLPLEQSIKLLLNQLNLGDLAGKYLGHFVLKGDIDRAKSFRLVNGFKQYRMTYGKVSNTLWHHVLVATRDEVICAYLQGGAYAFVHMACYYTSLPVKKLVDIYIKTASNIFEFHQLPLKLNIKDKGQDVRIGSLRKPEAETIQRFLDIKHEHQQKLKLQLKTEADLWNYHNELVLYTILMLHLSTSHRLNSDPYYSINNLIDEFLMQVTEKEVMAGFEGRLSILSKQSKIQYECYIKHLKNLLKLASSSECLVLKQMLTSLIDGSQNPKNGIPLFFLVKDNNLQKITRKILAEYYSSEEGVHLEDNFYRHFLSSELALLKAPRILIATQMGHISKGLEPFSATSTLSPDSFRKQFTPFLEALFLKLDIKTSLPPHVAKYQQLTITEVIWLASKLGPFQRMEDREVSLNLDNIASIDKVLNTTFDTSQKGLRIDIAQQKNNQNLLQKNDFKQPKRTLHSYYVYKRSSHNWSIESFKSLDKSRFDKSFGGRYKKGKKVVLRLKELMQKYLAAEIELTDKQAKILFALSALVSGSVFKKQHLLAIPIKCQSNFQDLKYTMSVELKDKNGNIRVWFLNSLSYALLRKNISVNDISIDESEFSVFLKKYTEVKDLSSAIGRIKAFLSVMLPGFIMSYLEKTSMQSSIGIDGYQELEGNYSSKNKQEDANFNLIETSTSPTILTNQTEKYLADLSSLLRIQNDKNNGSSATLKSVEKWERNVVAESVIGFAEKMLILWVKTRLVENELAVSTVMTYYSKVYRYVVQEFSAFNSIDEVEDDYLKDSVYPSIFKQMRSDKENDESKVPYSELMNFHSFLAEVFGFDLLHFSQKRVQSVASVQGILTEQEYQASLAAIDSHPDADPDLILCLKICLILYKKCGLRKGEVFKLQPKNICLKSKTIHISGNATRAEKTTTGNRLLPYDQLLTNKEIELLERWSIKVNNATDEQVYLLFNQYIKQLSYEVVVLRVSNFITHLIRSVTNNPKLSIKSLRKSFASESLLKLFDAKNNEVFFHTENQKQAHKQLKEFITDSFNTQHPHNLFWLLADWMGHTTPTTTFEYYSQTLDFIVFLSTEEMAEKHDADYLNRLRSFSSDIPLNDSVFKNLNRYKGVKYLKFYEKHLSTFKKNDFQSRSPNYRPLFYITQSNETKQKILALFHADIDCAEIEQKLILEKGVAKQVIEKAINLVTNSQQVKLPVILLKKLISEIIWWRFDGNHLASKRISKLTKQVSGNVQNLNVQERRFLFDLWYKNAFTKKGSSGAFVVDTQDEVRDFLIIYNLFQAHTELGGYLLIKIIGIKNNEDNLASVFPNYVYVKFEDVRKINENAFPEKKFELYLSFRSEHAKKMATCSFGLYSAIVFAMF